MKDILIQHIAERFNSYNDLAAATNDTRLGTKLEIERHKSMAEHLWCVVGARESYTASIRAGEWQGFACSLTAFTQGDFTKALLQSAEHALNTFAEISDWTDARTGLLIALHEHEVMHEGQIIRHLYGIGEPIPGSVKWA